jgi:hypothetical protein
MKSKFLILAAAFVTLTACEKPAQSVSAEGINGAFEVEFLFEKEGVRVYRFYDNGRNHYFTTRGETITTQKSGKSHYDETIKEETQW